MHSPKAPPPPFAGTVRREGVFTFGTPASTPKAPLSTLLADPARRSGGGGGGGAAAGLAPPPAATPPSTSYLHFLRQLLLLPSLRSYVAIATLQAFDCSFGKSFYTLMLAALWVQAFGDSAGLRLAGGTQALLVCASFLLPHALTLLCEPLVLSLGIRRMLQRVVVFRTCLALAAGLGALLWLTPRPTPTPSGRAPLALPAPHAHAPAPAATTLLFMTAIAYQLLSRVTSETVCRNLALLKAAVVDDFRRAQGALAPAPALREAEEGRGIQGSASGAAPASSEAPGAGQDRPAALIGAADFFPRVAASAAPVLGYALLQWGGGAGVAAGVHSSALILLALVVVPGTVSAAQSALIRADAGIGQ